MLECLEGSRARVLARRYIIDFLNWIIRGFDHTIVAFFVHHLDLAFESIIEADAVLFALRSGGRDDTAGRIEDVGRDLISFSGRCNPAR